MTAIVVVKDPKFDRWYSRTSESLFDPGTNDSAFLAFCRRTNGNAEAAAEGLFKTGSKLWQSSLYTAYSYEQVIRTARIAGAEWIFEYRSYGWVFARMGAQLHEFIQVLPRRSNKRQHRASVAVGTWLHNVQSHAAMPF